MKAFFSAILPQWLRDAKKHLRDDMVAGIIVGILVIPQSLGYALIAGLPPVYGLYAAIAPVLIYAWIGSSSAVAVGPVAIMAIMTAQALQPFDVDAATYIRLSITLTFLVGCLLLAANWLKLGWITQFISRGVTAGFVSGAGILIGLSQLKYVTGTHINSANIPMSIQSLWKQADNIHTNTLLLAVITLGILLIARFWLQKPLQRITSKKNAQFIVRIIPLIVVIIQIIISYVFLFKAHGIAVIGHIPPKLPPVSIPMMNNIDTLLTLLPSAALIALIGFVSSASLAAQFGRIRGEKFYANTELKAQGLANFGGAFFSSFPVAGGFSRTAVNVDAGAKTPMAGIFAALLMMAALLFFGQLLAPLPYAVLGAGIMAAVVSLLDVDTLKTALKTDKADAACFLITFFTVILLGLNTGLVTGLLFSFATLIWRTSQPHIAVVGQVVKDNKETGHFRNIKRHQVTTYDNLLILRIDESLFYGNAASVKQIIEQAIDNKPQATEVILMLSAVNHIDLAAQDMLAALDKGLVQQNKRLHLSFIKGPVMDFLQHTAFLKALSGQVFLNTKSAVQTLTKH